MRRTAPAETSPTQTASSVSASWDGLPPTSMGAPARPPAESMATTEFAGNHGAPVAASA